MHSYSFSAVSGILTFLIAEAVAYPENLRGLIQRQACYDTTVLLALKQVPDDTYPFCRSFLGIADVTTTLPAVTKVITTSTLVTTVFDSPSTVTIPSETSFITVTTTVDNIVEPRQKLRPRADPTLAKLASSILSKSDLDGQLASLVSSGCSCLRLFPSTVEGRVTEFLVCSV